MKTITKILSATILIISISMIVIRTFVGEITFVTSNSMFPTLASGDKVWSNKWIYGIVLPRRLKEVPLLNIACLIPLIENADKKTDWGYHRIGKQTWPERMDIILFKWEETDSQLYIKRVIGLPGDTIEIKKGKVYIGNQLLKEEVTDIVSTDDYGPVIVKEQSYFVMGDCRTNSTDSRTRGLVEFRNIVGKASYKLGRGEAFNKWKSLY